MTHTISRATRKKPNCMVIATEPMIGLIQSHFDLPFDTIILFLQNGAQNKLWRFHKFASPQRVTFSIVHTGVSRKPNDSNRLVVDSCSTLKAAYYPLTSFDLYFDFYLCLICVI